MKKLIGLRIFAAVFAMLYMPSWSWAFYSEHPLASYERGMNILNSYQGEDQKIQSAQFIFRHIIEKHSDSPLGYLGMSQAKIIEAYRWGRHYNMHIIVKEALPMALKAMRTGPTLNMVQDHYDRYTEIFKINEQNQENLRHQLRKFPENMETYISLADYLSDQGDFTKAIEYYQMVYRSAETKGLKLRAAMRIGHVYTYDLKDWQHAQEFEQMIHKLSIELSQNPN